jgi:hypothetical protein
MSILKELGEKYKLQWLISVIGTNESEEGLSVAICEKTRKIAVIADPTNFMVPFVVVDVYYDSNKQQCEEEKRCLCLDCEYNKTTFTSYKNSGGLGKLLKSKKAFTQLIARMEESNNLLQSLLDDIVFDGRTTVFNSPSVVFSFK